MQQTEKYQFNIIDTSDAFGPEKLNENAQKLEDALIAHEGTVTAALSQHKTETDAALGTKADKTTLDALTKTVTANKTAADTTIAAVEKGANLVHLAGPLTRANTSDAVFNVKLSGLNLAQYRALLIITRTTISGTITVGNMTVTLANANGKYTGGMVWLLNTDSTVTMIAKRVTYGNNYAVSQDGIFSETSWTSLTSIVGSSTVMFMDVYGIKA